MRVSFSTEGLASNFVSRRATTWAVRQVGNQGGTGQTRKGPQTTFFCTRENISVLCTSPIPDQQGSDQGRVCLGVAPDSG